MAWWSEKQVEQNLAKDFDKIPPDVTLEAGVGACFGQWGYMVTTLKSAINKTTYQKIVLQQSA